MTRTNITNFRNDIFRMMEQVIRYNDPIGVTTKDGSCVVMSEEEYNGIMETLYLYSVPGLAEEIIEARNTPIEERIPASEVEW